MNSSKQSELNSNNVHPICRNSPDPEKCALFAEKLEGVNSNLSLTEELAARITAERKSENS